MSFEPTRADRFTFGLWTVNWSGQDQFGAPSRTPMSAPDIVRKLSDLGAYGISLHDDDVAPYPCSDAEREAAFAALRRALEETGLVAAMGSTSLFTHPVFKDGGLTSNDRDVRRFALRKVLRSIDTLAELGVKTFVFWGGRDGSEYDLAKDVRGALARYREGIDLTCDYIRSRGYDMNVAIEPKPNEPRGDILLPTVGAALGFIATLAHPEMVGLNPETGHEQMTGLNYVHSIAQALDAGKLFHIDLNGQRGAKFDQDLVFAHGDLFNAFALVDLIENGGPGGTPCYDGPRHFDYKPSRTEDEDGVWESARANMRSYLILKERAKAFRADPEVAAALAAAKVEEIARPTLADGEDLEALLADRSAFEDFDAASYFGGKGFGFVRLHQLALEHLLVAR